MDEPPERVASLDLIRGIAVLGILAVNIAGFAGPSADALSPHMPMPGGFADETAFALVFVLFEGKMRGLFTLLFGASMVLFIDRAEAAGRDGDILQLRRLGWLMAFGLAHFFLFWWGDILFLYAAAGLVALFMRELTGKVLLTSALIIFAGWHISGMAISYADIRAEEQVRMGVASPRTEREHAAILAQVATRAADELREYRAGFTEQVSAKLSERTLRPIEMTFTSIGETLPMILIGMVLFRTGFFSGGWSRTRLRRTAAVGIGVGTILTVLMLAWLWPRHFPVRTMSAALLYWTALPHLLMTLGYAALLALAAPGLARTWIGRRLTAAGRMAFSNYVGTTVVMTAIFYGWGLGLIGTVGHAEQFGFVLLGWLLMLAWSTVWLARFRSGPLEWLWRRLAKQRPPPAGHK